MKKLCVKLRLGLNNWLTTERHGYIKITLIAISLFVISAFLIFVFKGDLHNLYYFLNFNYPDNSCSSTPLCLKWKYLIIGVVGMILVNGLLLLVVTSGVQRWVERIRGGQKTYKWITNHYVMIGFDHHQSINIINNMSIDKDNRLVILTKKDPEAVRARLQASIKDYETLRSIIIYAGGRERIKTLNLQYAKEVFILVEGSEWESQYTRSMNILREVALQSQQPKEKLKTNILISDIKAYNMIERLNIPKFEGIERLDVHPFNLYDNWARLLWSYNSKKKTDGNDFYDQLDFEPIENTNKHVHLVIVAFNSMGRALWQEAVRIAHYPNFVENDPSDGLSKNKTIITVVDPNSKAIEQEINVEYPNLASQIADIEFQFREGRIEDEDVRNDLVRWAADKNEMLTVAICHSEPDTALSMALSLPQALFYTYDELRFKPNEKTIDDNLSRTRILVRQSIKTSVNELTSNYNNLYKNLKFFGNYSEAYNPELMDDDIAICVNGIYSGKGKDGTDLNASFYDISKLSEIDINEHFGYWEKCWKTSTTEQSKLSNRYQIDHYRTTLPILRRNPNIMEQMAQAEHHRWIAERTLAGWKQKKDGEMRVNELKIHTDIVPYHNLDEQEKTKDKNVVNFAIKLAEWKADKDLTEKQNNNNEAK